MWGAFFSCYPIPMISSVSIRRFKNIGTITLDLTRINVLVGTNNSGKSSVLHALQFAVSLMQTASLEGKRFQQGVSWAISLNPDRLIYAPLRDVFTLGRGGDLRQPEHAAIEIEFTSTNTDETAKVIARRGRNRNLHLNVKGSHSLCQTLATIDPPFAMYVPGLSGISATESFRNAAVLDRAAARGDANSVFRNVLLKLKEDTPKWEMFRASLAEIFPSHTVEVTFDPIRDEHILAQVSHHGVTVPIDAAGTGFLQTAQILAYSSAYSPKLLLLDEPDSHIHPDRQRALMHLLHRLSTEQDFQVVIATHSRHLLDEFEPEASFHWLSKGSKVDESDFDRVRVLMDLGALDQGDLLKQGQVKCVVLSEDAMAADTHKRSRKSALRILLQASGLPMDRTQVWSYTGCTNIHTAKVLSKFIRDVAPDVKVLVHLDRDYETDESIIELSQAFAAQDIVLFVTTGTDTESHFISAEHIKELYPELEMPDIVAMISETYEEAKHKSLRRFACADDKRIRGLPKKPNSQDLADQRIAQYEANPARFCYGKHALGLIKAKLQSHLGTNPNLLRTSASVRIEVLEEFAKTIPALVSHAVPTS